LKSRGQRIEEILESAVSECAMEPACVLNGEVKEDGHPV
jgi:hypothetical protein